MVYVRLGTNLERDRWGGGVGIIYGFCASLNVGAHTMIVARSEGAQVGETMESDGVFGGGETERSRVLGDTALSDVVGCFGTDKEAITAEHSVGGKCGTLHGGDCEHVGKGIKEPARSHEP